MQSLEEALASLLMATVLPIVQAEMILEDDLTLSSVNKTYKILRILAPVLALALNVSLL